MASSSRSELPQSSVGNCRFLVSGDVRGNFQLLFKKVQRSISKCGSFAFLLCTGSFFGSDNSGWEYFKTNPDRIPIQVYVLGPNTVGEIDYYSSVDKPSSLNDKITFVGQSGIFTTYEGIKIAYVSGIESVTKDENVVYQTADVKSLLSKGMVDILFTSQWPKYITNNGMTEFRPQLPSPLIAELLMKLKPRYCFSGWENKFYERIPIIHHDDDSNIEYLTRFCGLAFVGNPNEKWLYAVNMDFQRKLSELDAKQMTHYLKFQPYKDQVPGPSKTKGAEVSGQGRRSTKRQYQTALKCWFCLSNGEEEHHLVIIVGKHIVMSLAKGGLVRDHLCLTPINHVASVSQLNEDIIIELNHYKNLIIEHYLNNKGKEVIFYERYYKTVHAQVNCIPVERSLSANIKASYIEEASGIGVEMTVYPPKSDFLKNISAEHLYFHAVLPNGEELFCIIPQQSDFPLEFGRNGLVKQTVLNIPDRRSWKDCTLDISEEKLIVKKLREELQF